MLHQNPMNHLLRIGVSTGVIGLIISSVLVFALAVLRMMRVSHEIMRGEAGFPQELEMIGTVDLLLLGIGILIIAAGMISLTTKKINMPRGLRAHDLHHLKSTFSSFLILIMAILYLENMASLKQLESTPNSHPEALLYAGLGFLAVTGGLVIFQRSGSHSHGGDPDASADQHP